WVSSQTIKLFFPRQSQPSLESALLCVREFEPAAEAARDDVDDREPEAGAARMQMHEAIGQLAQFFRLDTFALVAHGPDAVAVLPMATEENLRSLGREAYGVVQQIAQGRCCQRRRGVDCRLAGGFKPQLQSLLLHFRADIFHGVGSDY